MSSPLANRLVASLESAYELYAAARGTAYEATASAHIVQTREIVLEYIGDVEALAAPATSLEGR